MVRLGFTGTHTGMDGLQATLFRAFVKHLQPDVFNHGDCVGADAQAHDIVREEVPRCHIVIYPCTHAGARAFKQGDESYLPKPPLKRNHDIVNASTEMVATPASYVEVLRSGTWATIRYTRKVGKRLTIL